MEHVCICEWLPKLWMCAHVHVIVHSKEACVDAWVVYNDSFVCDFV